MSNSPLRRSGMACVNERSQSFTCHPHVYPQVVWTTPAFTPSHRVSPPLADTHFTVPRRTEGWVDLGGWLHTKIKCRREWNPDMVIHSSTNRAQRRLTSLIKTNVLPLRQTATSINTFEIMQDTDKTLIGSHACLSNCAISNDLGWPTRLLLRPQEQCEVLWLASLSVSPLSYLKNTSKPHKIFCLCYLWPSMAQSFSNGNAIYELFLTKRTQDRQLWTTTIAKIRAVSQSNWSS